MATKVEMKQAAYRVWAEQKIAERVVERCRSSLVGRSFEVGDPRQVEDFAAWYLDMAEVLGVKVQVLKE